MNSIIFLLPARKTRKVPDLRLIGYCCSSRLRNQSKREGVLRIERGKRDLRPPVSLQRLTAQVLIKKKKKTRSIVTS